MKYRCWFQCIDPECEATYDIFEVIYRCRRCNELLEVVHDGVHSLPVGLADRGPLVSPGQGPEHAHALGRSQREVVARPGLAGGVLGFVALNLRALEDPDRAPAVATRHLTSDEEAGRLLASLGLHLP